MSTKREQINFLVNRAYPVRKDKGRDISSRTFREALYEQPDHVVELLYRSAREYWIKKRTEKHENDLRR